MSATVGMGIKDGLGQGSGLGLELLPIQIEQEREEQDNSTAFPTQGNAQGLA